MTAVPLRPSRSILAVRGLDTTSQDFRARFWEMAARNGWDVDAIAAVISIESGFKHSAKSPVATASGLIQMIDSTAKSLGIAGGAAAVRSMSAVEQLPWIEKYYRNRFGTRRPRPVDFYLAGWGTGIGQPDSYVLAREDAELTFNGGTHNLYTLNSGLDSDGDGVITVGDLRALIERVQRNAGGRRLDATPSGAGLFWPCLLSLLLVGVMLRRRLPT